MDPRLSDTEVALQEKASSAAASVKAAASSIDSGETDSHDLLVGLGSEGVFAACLPEGQGGTGGGLIHYALVCEELGAASASVAAAAIGHLVAAFVIESCGSEADKQALLPELSSGGKIAALVLDGGGSLLEAPSIAATAKGEDGEVSLDGVARAVSGATHADVFVVPARDGAEEGAAVRVFVLEKGAAGLAVGEEQKKLGLNGSGLAAVTLEDAVPRTELSGADRESALDAAADAARIGLAALCAGISRAALEMSTEYVSGSDDGLDRAQSVQWMLADTATEAEAGRLLTWYAASRQDAGELRESAAMARVVAADAAIGATRRAVQILGASGNEQAAGVERLYRDAKAMEVHHGAVESQRREVARQLLPDLFEGARRG